MDRNKRGKRTKPDGLWDCSVCTYKNSPEAFKCEMCDVRKGTSTRKPKPNPQLVAQQVVQQLPPPPPPPPPKREKHLHKKSERPELNETENSQDHNIDVGHKTDLRTSKQNVTQQQQQLRQSRPPTKDYATGRSMEVTVGDLTVVITDYEPKTKRKRSSTDDSRDSTSIETDSSGSPKIMTDNKVPD